VIGFPDHHWKPATAATDTITPVTMSFFMSAILIYVVPGANLSGTL
jgi:hypothetical protein